MAWKKNSFKFETLNEYLDYIEDNDYDLYDKTMNLVNLTHTLGKILRCDNYELQLLYTVSCLFYLDPTLKITKQYKQEQKIIKNTKVNRNVQCIDYTTQKINLIVFVCDVYNTARQTKSHLEALAEIDEHFYIPEVVKKGFKQAIRNHDLLETLCY